MPDVVAYRDFVFSGSQLCNDLAAGWRSYVPDRLETLPYPNGSRLRSMAVARCPDLVMLRAAGGRIIKTTDAMLSERVLSSRLDSTGLGWSFTDPRRSHGRWRKNALAEVHADPLAEAWTTDVANYFGSVDHHVMGSLLYSWRCDPHAIALVMNILAQWVSAGHVGLPIGPELSTVLGNALLLPADQALEQAGVSHYRYMDDVVVVGRTLDHSALEGTFDAALRPLRLHRSEIKTHHYEAGQASEAVEDTLLSYLTRDGANRLAPNELVELLEEESGESYPDAKRLRFALHGLDDRNDGSALGMLCRHHGLLNADPLETCNYLAKYGLRSQAVRDKLMEVIAQPGDERTLALRVHAARAASRCPWGGSEGQSFIALALNERLHPSVRAHAWQAAARTPAGKPHVIMEAANEERHPAVRRAAVLSLARTSPSTMRRTFLQKMTADEYVRYAAAWLDAA